MTFRKILKVSSVTVNCGSRSNVSVLGGKFSSAVGQCSGVGTQRWRNDDGRDSGCVFSELYTQSFFVMIGPFELSLFSYTYLHKELLIINI